MDRWIGEWCSYNFAAGSFHTKKLCSRLFSREVEFYLQKQQNHVLCHPFGDLGVTYTVHLWFVGKRVVDFLLALIELFCHLSRLRRYKQILVEIAVFEMGVCYFERKFQGGVQSKSIRQLYREGGRSPTNFGFRKLESLGYHAALIA